MTAVTIATVGSRHFLAEIAKIHLVTSLTKLNDNRSVPIYLNQYSLLHLQLYPEMFFQLRHKYAQNKHLKHMLVLSKLTVQIKLWFRNTLKKTMCTDGIRKE